MMQKLEAEVLKVKKNIYYKQGEAFRADQAKDRKGKKG